MRTLLKIANERSTYPIRCTFTDATGTAVTPEAVTWTLTTEAGAVINGRENQTEDPRPSLDVILSGADLAVSENQASVRRILTIRATYTTRYNEAEYVELPYLEQIGFDVQNLAAIT